MKRPAPKASGAVTEGSASDVDRDRVLADYERSIEKSEAVTLVGRILKDGKPRSGVVMALYRSPAEAPNRHTSKPFAEMKTRKPEGGSILHPAIARPRRNQSDMRILFDPSLTKKPDRIDTTAETRPAP